MSKEQQPVDSDLEGLYILLNGFIENKTPLESAKEILQGMYINERLAELLEKYYNEHAVFEALFACQALQSLLIFLCSVNPKIITMPLQEGEEEEEEGNHLLSVVFNSQANYIELFDWLNEKHPALIQNEKTLVEVQKKAILKDAIYYIKHKQLKAFNELLRESPDTIVEILKETPALIKELMPVRRQPYLKALISLNLSVLRINYGGQSILASLCKNPKINSSVFEQIRDYYFTDLTDKEQELLQEVLEDDDSDEDVTLTESQKTLTSHLPKKVLSGQSRPNVKSPMLTTPQIESLFLSQPGAEFNIHLLPFINTSMYLDNAVLDAFSYQIFRDKLAKKRIALMPTIRQNEPISLELLMAIRSGGTHLYTTGLFVENQQIIPITEEKPIAQDLRYAVWPVNLSNAHYGLFILDLTAPNLSPTRGFYIETFNSQHMLQLIFSSGDAAYRAHLKSLNPAEIKKTVHSWMYATYLKTLTQNLHMSPKSFNYIFLSQSAGENYCSDYVIAVLARLASDGIDLINNPANLLSLKAGHLGEDMVKKIRMLETQMFGNDYFLLQMPAEPTSHKRLELVNMTIPSQQDDKQEAAKQDETNDKSACTHKHDDDESARKRRKVYTLFQDAEDREHYTRQERPNNNEEGVNSDVKSTYKTM